MSQRVESREVNHAPAAEVGPDDDFRLKLVEHAREHDTEPVKYLSGSFLSGCSPPSLESQRLFSLLLGKTDGARL